MCVCVRVRVVLIGFLDSDWWQVSSNAIYSLLNRLYVVYISQASVGRQVAANFLFVLQNCSVQF